MQHVHSAPVRRTVPRPAVLGGALVLILIVLVLLFQWNWLRAPLAAAISGRLHRPVAISGDLEVHPWSWSPWLRINDLAIGNPPWAGGGVMARLPRLTVQMSLPGLLRGKVILPLVRADRPSVRLVTNPDGRDNWNFSNAKPGTPVRLPAIGQLVISDGSLTFADVRRRLTFAGRISGNEGPGIAGPNLTTISGGLVIGAAPWAGPEPVARAPRLVVRVKLLSLSGGRLVIPLVEADEPVVRLVRDASGRANWETGKTQKPLKLPPINQLIISNGVLHFDDAQKKLNFSGTVSSSETTTGPGRGAFLLTGKGLLNKAPFLARVTGDSLINIDARRPYRFDARIEAGATRVAMAGAIAHPFDLGVLSGRLGVSGPTLADLYHLTGVATPATPPYDLTAGFARVGEHYALRRLGGRVGDSDLAGDVTLDNTSGRPFLDASLISRRLKLADLAAVIGGVPKHTVGHTLSPAQKAMAAKLRTEHRIFPDAPLEVSRLRTTDAKLVYRAQSVDGGRGAIRALSMKLALNHGVLTVDPLAMTLPQGDLTGVIRLDARGAIAAESVDVRLANARLENLVGRGGVNPPLEGGLYARAKLSGTGDSVRAAAAGANGQVTVVISKGEIRQAMAELIGINATKGLFLLIAKNQGETPIRCAVADFRAQGGVLTAQRIVFDTGVVLATGKGRIDLRDETVDLQLNGKPKKFRLVRINAPLTLKGSLASPKFGVDIPKAAGQLAIGALLGAAVGPLAAVLPFVSLGLAKDADCAALTSDAAARGAPVAKR